ncbi:hypothetical protein CDAR_59361 [Caerostris darwini]|uniref:Uncharacterized protein n=1 Tax=Caerostris darwini TaxID=1538125 RepID=A0AAV4X222_9ARAC|nr:hypothetical protein CDAR_59361 [Caerostris darwini]
MRVGELLTPNPHANLVRNLSLSLFLLSFSETPLRRTNERIFSSNEKLVLIEGFLSSAKLLSAAAAPLFKWTSIKSVPWRRRRFIFSETGRQSCWRRVTGLLISLPVHIVS